MRYIPFSCLTVAVFGVIAGADAAPLAPRQEWAAGIESQNKAYAKTPHAMLKIQDSVYLREGDAAAVSGRPGKPGSWRWNNEPGAKGLLTVSLRGGKLSVTQNGRPADPGQIEKGITIDPGIDVAGQRTQVAAGIEGWRIFLYNQTNPSALYFTGVSYYPYNPAFRITAHFVPDMKLPARVFHTSRGTDKQFFHAGDAVFTLRGKTVKLPFYGESHDAAHVADMSAFFTDALTGKGNYDAGRYVDVAGFGKFPPASVTIDFNQAYNPNCARSSHFTCPVAVDAIPLAVRVGERDPHRQN